MSPIKFIAAFVFFANLSAYAQRESAPQEAPFIQEDNEFDSATSVAPGEMRLEDEIQSAEPNQSILPPSEQETVNLNADVPEAGSSWEDEIPVEADPIQQSSPAVPKSRYAQEYQNEISSEGVQKRSAKGGVEYIHHPMAAKGLLRIEKDGSYIYRTKDVKSSGQTGSFRFGMMEPPMITSTDGVTTFETMYSNGPVPVMSFDYEWRLFESLPHLTLQGGFGVMVAEGNGRFLNTSHTETPKEKYTFVALPLSVGLSYRMQYKSRQWLAPYVTGGGNYFPVAEFRDDGEGPNIVGTPGVFAAGGLMFSISAFSRDASFTLSNEYGISNLWASLEYRQIQTFSEEVDFSSGLVNLGISVDY